MILVLNVLEIKGYNMNHVSWSIIWHWHFMIYFIDHRLWFKIHNIWMEKFSAPMQGYIQTYLSEYWQRVISSLSFNFSLFSSFIRNSLFKLAEIIPWGILSWLILCRLSDEFIPAPILSLAYFRNETCISDISFSLAALRPLSASICFSWFHNYEITSRWYFIELILNQPEHISCALNWNSFGLFLTTFDIMWTV